MEATKTRERFSLDLDIEQMKSEIVHAPEQVEEEASSLDPELEAKATSYARHLLEIGEGEHDAREHARDGVERMGREIQKRCSRRSKMLQAPIRALAEKGEDGGEVANALTSLKEQVEELDPGSLDLKAGWISRTLGRLPGVGNPLKRYFSKFESAQTVIDAIDRSLLNGREQLRRDNITLREDQKEMRSLTADLERQIGMGQILDGKLAEALDGELAGDETRKGFVEAELLFPLRQRVMDLQQQLAVNQQGVLAIEIVRRNNDELMRGVDRARNVTMSALNVAVTVAMALQNQRINLERITALNTTTSGLIASTAAQLKTQGAEIHAQAASANLDMHALKSAFNDVNDALEAIASYRRKALPAMAATIGELDELGRRGEAAVMAMERTRGEDDNESSE